MKKYIMLLWVLTISSFVYGDNNTIDAFYNIYYSSSDTQKLETAFKKLKASDTGTSREYTLFLSGLVELFHFFSKTNTSATKADPALVANLKKAYTDMNEYAIQIGREDIGSSYLAMLSDIRIQIMTFEPMMEMVRMSNESKKDYELAIQKDYKNFHAHLGLGQWYYYAPKVGGGSLRKALDNYKVAETHAHKPYQKYLVYLWRSQVYFKNKKTKEAQAELAKAINIFSKGDFALYVKEINTKGKSL